MTLNKLEMNKEQLKRGNELQHYIEDIEKKIEAAKTGLDYPENVSIKICFNAYNPYELDTIMKKETIIAFKEHHEKLLEEAKAEFSNL